MFITLSVVYIVYYIVSSQKYKQTYKQTKHWHNTPFDDSVRYSVGILPRLLHLQ